MYKRGDKIRRVGFTHRIAKEGKIYTFRGYKNETTGSVLIEEDEENYGYRSTSFELASRKEKRDIPWL